MTKTAAPESEWVAAVTNKGDSNVSEITLFYIRMTAWLGGEESRTTGNMY